MSDNGAGIRGMLWRLRMLDKSGKKMSNIPPTDAQVTTGKGPWRVTRDRDGKVIMIEVWTETATGDWRFPVTREYTFLRTDR